MAFRGGLANTFLPAGFPASVRPEYVRYRCWDIVQVGRSACARTPSVDLPGGTDLKHIGRCACFLWNFSLYGFFFPSRCHLTVRKHEMEGAAGGKELAGK